jgi:hemerythrin superfamily protein
MDMTETRTDLDVVDVLMTDHQEVLDLIQQIKATENPEQRRDLADIVITELVRHSVSEEMYVYPEMREYLPNGEEAVKHDTDEHKKLEQIMKDLEGVDATDRRFDELVGALEATLRDHVHDEETQHFPELRARAPRKNLVELRDKVQAAKKLAPTRPHPDAPNNELFHKVVGPGVGLVDRLRDRLSGRATG